MGRFLYVVDICGIDRRDEAFGALILRGSEDDAWDVEFYSEDGQAPLRAAGPIVDLQYLSIPKTG